MSRDSDLLVTCKCGCIEIRKRNGYFISSFADTASLGLAASRLCRHRMRWLLRLSLALIVAVAGGVAVAGVVEERGKQVTAEAAAYCSEGEVRLANGDDLGAVEAFTRALAIRPKAVTFLDRGFCRYRMGDYVAAVADCEKALELDPANKAAVKNRRLAMEASGASGNPSCESTRE